MNILPFRCSKQGLGRARKQQADACILVLNPCGAARKAQTRCQPWHSAVQNADPIITQIGSAKLSNIKIQHMGARKA
jgi:hypothetical protein